LVFVSASTGQVNLAASTPGTYTVTNTIAASGGCGVVTATSPITIKHYPSDYGLYGYTFCDRHNSTARHPEWYRSTTGGIFTSPAGLTINLNRSHYTQHKYFRNLHCYLYHPCLRGCPAIPVTT
jgi:hypothetical protein